MTRVEDPGWRRAAGGVWFLMIPTKGARMALKSTNSLLLMRQLWVTFLAAVTFLWVPVLVIHFSGGLAANVDGRLMAAVVVGVGVFGQLLAGTIVAPVSGPTEEAARRSFQRSLLVRIALGEIGALVGFVGFLLSGNPLVYLAGYVVTLAGMFDAAPTVAKIDRSQRQLIESGSGVNLLGALVKDGITR